MERWGRCSRKNRAKNACHGVVRCTAPAHEAHEAQPLMSPISRERKGVIWRRLNPASMYGATGGRRAPSRWGENFVWPKKEQMSVIGGR